MIAKIVDEEVRRVERAERKRSRRHRHHYSRRPYVEVVHDSPYAAFSDNVLPALVAHSLTSQSDAEGAAKLAAIAPDAGKSSA